MRKNLDLLVVKLPAIAGAIVCIIGMVVICGWYSHNDFIIQILPSMPKMRYNTALCFFLSGLAMLLLGRNKNKSFLILVSSTTLIISVLTLLQYITGISLQIDDFFFKTNFLQNSSYPGRMAPNSAIAFTLISVAQIITAKFLSTKYGVLLSLLFSIVSLVIGFTGLVWFTFHLDQGFSWLHFTRMALLTSVGFIILSVGLLFYISREKKFKENNQKHWHEILVGFLGLLLTISLWNTSIKEEEKQTVLLTREKMHAFKSELHTILVNRFQALERIARRWEFANGTNYKAWYDDVSYYIKDQPEYQGIVWADKTYHIRWMYPEKYNEKLKNFDLTSEKKRYSALKNAYKTHKGSISQTLKLLNGDTGFIYCVSLQNHNKKFDGFIIGGYNFKKLIDSVLGYDATFYDITIYDNNKPVYINSSSNSESVYVDDKFFLHGNTWKFRLKLSKELTKSIHSPLAMTELLIGSMLSFLLMGIIFSVKEIKLQSSLLYKNDEQFKLSISCIKDYAIFMLDPKGYITTWNSGAEKLNGYTENEIIGKHFSIFYSPDLITKGFPSYELQVAKEHGQFKDEGWRIRKDGSIFRADVLVTAIYDTKNELIGFSKVTRDLTEQMKAEEILKLNVKRFEAIFHNTYQFISILSTDGIIQEANHSALITSGARIEDVIGKYVWETPWWIYSEEMQNRLKQAVKKASEGEFIFFEGTHPTKRGDLMIVDFALKPVIDDQHQVTMLVLVPEARDISLIRQAELDVVKANRSFNDIRKALDVSTIVTITNGNGNITYVNDAFCRLSKYSKEEVINKNIKNLDFISRDLEFYQKISHTLLQGNIWKSEIENKAKDDTCFWVDATIVPLLNEQGNIEQYVAICHNITENKQLQVSLFEAKQASEQASRFKSEFLATISHEIRTPINGILGMTEIALNTLLSQQQRNYLDMVYNSGTALLTIINGILDFSKIEAGKLELDPICFNLRQSINEAVYPFELKAHEQSINLKVEVNPGTPDYLEGDISRIRQIIVNLLGNALKFTEEGSVTLGIEPLEVTVRSAIVHFWVKDTGIGMTNEQQGKVFKPFIQADSSTTRKFGGTGLGLAISHQLVELMNGRFWLESIPDQGSTFHFSIPLKIATMTSEKVKKVNLEALISTRVLIVDDNPTNLLIQEEMLKQWYMLPTTANNADEALALMEKSIEAGHPYQLVLSDYGMPVMDGYMLAKKIKSSEKLKNTKIIILSSYGQSVDMNDFDSKYVEGYMTKPFSNLKLLNVIKNIMGVLNESDILPESLLPNERIVYSPLKSIKILLAEDNEINQSVALQILEEAGHVVSIAKNGIEAVEKFQQDSFDLILMDVHMPKLDGYEATRKIRELATESQKGLPIIALTANAIIGDKERCLANGMNGYLSKPFKRQELLNTISMFTADCYQSPSKVNVLDQESLLERFNGSIKNIDRFYKRFQDQLPEQLKVMNDAIQTQDHLGLEEVAHKLKGTVSNFTTGSCYTLLASLEQIGRDNNFTNVELLFSELEESLIKLHKTMNSFIEKPVYQLE